MLTLYSILVSLTCLPCLDYSYSHRPSMDKFGTGTNFICAILGVKKYLWFRFPTDPIFSADPLIFSKLLTVRPSGWLRAAAKMAPVVTLIIEKTMKKYSKKIISDLPTLIFSWYKPEPQGFFLRPTRLILLSLC